MHTQYHSQYWAHALTLRGSGGDITSLSRSIANARVDLNPHQIDAALFALRSPFTNGAVLADEVGLGKTVEAGIVLAQRWAERRRRILIVVPAMLRKQWQQELSEKFFLPSDVLDSRVFNRLVNEGMANPFDQKDRAVICSYNFAAAKTAEVSQIPWDAVVIDEAHRLRNVHRSRTRLKNNPAAGKTMAHRIADAVGNAPKLLLTATPLQNSLLELFSLISVIDEHVFGDVASFREQFLNNTDEVTRNLLLKQRIAPVCTRALREQVSEYIPFTNRIPITQEFLPTAEEQTLYDDITTYLQREILYALPASQRQLITMVLRKLLASSTFAIARTLRRLADRLETMRDALDLLDDEDLEGIDELVDEYGEDADDDVLGALESGVDIERRIADVYQTCRTNAEIQAAFDALQAELDAKIQARLAATRQVLLEHFDEDVRDRLRFSQERTLECLSRREQWLLALSRVELDGQAEFDDEKPRFRYTGTDASRGWYNLDWKAADATDERFYRPDHPLAVRLISQAIDRDLPCATLALDYTSHPSKISVVEPLVGQSGWLQVSRLTVSAVEVDEFLIFAGQTDHHRVLDEEICRKLLSLPGVVDGAIPDKPPDLLPLRRAEVDARTEEIGTRNGQLFDEEVLKLDRWSEDLKLSLEREIRELDKQIRELRRTAVLAQALQDKLAFQKQIRECERRRNGKRRELFDAQDAIDNQREELIVKIEKRLTHTTTVKPLFVIRWEVR